MTLGQQISQLKFYNSDLACNRIISRGIIRLIQRDPFYGMLLAKLNRVVSYKLRFALGMGWLNNQITLLYNPREFVNRIHTGGQLLFWLEHEALHLIYLHPVRYPENTMITKIATDITVNQVIPQRITHELTLNQVNRRWGLKLPSGVNSRLYINQLTRFFNHQRKGRKKMGHELNIKRILRNRSDDHHFWGGQTSLNRSAKVTMLKRLIRRSYHDTPAKARGTLPGQVDNQLRRLREPSPINWRAYVKMGLGEIPFGRRASRARFNRRQAYRMDLTGTVSDYVQPVSIFVDNSGSMGDYEISYLLSQLGDFLKKFPVNVDVYSFDSKVHGSKHYRANRFRQLKFVRIGGGGTRFQSIFDYCRNHLRAGGRRLIIILTDGYGEDHLNYYGFTNLLWILSQPSKEFSVKNRRGQFVSLFNELKTFDTK